MPEFKLAKRKPPHNHSNSLCCRIPAHPGNNGHKYRKGNHCLDGIFKHLDYACRKECGCKVQKEPRGAQFNGPPRLIKNPLIRVQVCHLIEIFKYLLLYNI